MSISPTLRLRHISIKSFVGPTIQVAASMSRQNYVGLHPVHPERGCDTELLRKARILNSKGTRCSVMYGGISLLWFGEPDSAYCAPE